MIRIENANLNEAQQRIIQRCCQIRIEHLHQLAVDPSSFLEEINRKHQNLNATVDDIYGVIDAHLEVFEELYDNPDQVFMLEDNHQRQVQFIIAEHIDKYDGNPDVNGIWGKFFKVKDYNTYPAISSSYNLDNLN